MKGLLYAASVSALLIAAPAFAQNAEHSQSTQSQSSQSQSLSSQDKQFIKEASAANLAEVEAGQLAEQKAAKPAVKEFGRWMATDHSFANKRLMAIAEELDAWQQPQLTQEQKQLKQKLQGLSGQQFDQQYLHAMVQDHKKDIQKFEKQAQNGQNQKIKHYAGDLTPVLQQHLAEAQELVKASGMASGVGSSATGASGSSTPTNAQQLNRHELNQMQKK